MSHARALLLRFTPIGRVSVMAASGLAVYWGVFGLLASEGPSQGADLLATVLAVVVSIALGLLFCHRASNSLVGEVVIATLCVPICAITGLLLGAAFMWIVRAAMDHWSIAPPRDGSPAEVLGAVLLPIGGLYSLFAGAYCGAFFSAGCCGCFTDDEPSSVDRSVQ